MRQSFVIYVGRKLPGKPSQTVAVEVQLACESETMNSVEQMEFMAALMKRSYELVIDEYGGKEIAPPRPQQE